MENRGIISGVVRNASQANAPAAGSDVVLRMRSENEFVILGQTTADQWGRFRFDNLPVGKYYEYLPGANRDGVHYPSPAVQISPEQPYADVELSVCDSISAPNPLVLRHQKIRLRSEPGVLYVSESLVVDNPSSTCYVGQAPREGAEPVTLQLSIPADFERVTFDEEYFGRRFAVSQGKLVTGLPWPPGKKEVKFTYSIRNAEASRIWQRSLDLPCADVCMSVQTAKPREVACNLSPATVEKNEAIFHSAGKPLPAGFVISVNLDHLPVLWMTYARWVALAVLIGTVAGVGFFTRRRRGSPTQSASVPKRNQDPTPTNRRLKHRPLRGSSRIKS